LIQIAAGILIPLLAAAIPVVRGSRVSVRVALDNFGISTQKQSRWASFIAGTNLFGNTYSLSLRNAFRQRSRLMLTLGLLAAGGAMFMTAMNVSDAWEINLRRIYSQRLYDQEIRLNNDHKPDSLFRIVKGIDGVTIVEGWDATSTAITKDSKYKVTKTYPDKGMAALTFWRCQFPQAF
jgi:putative ABC transport system permease protein